MSPFRTLLILCLSALATACGAPRANRDTIDAAIYAALMDSLVRKAHDSVVVVTPLYSDIFTDSSANGASREAGERLKRIGTSEDLLRDFRTRNARAEPVQLQLRLSVPFAIDTMRPLTDDEEKSLFGNATDIFGVGFERYRQAYPGIHRLLTLSRTGLARDGKTALLYVESYCGALCGGGDLVLLRLEAGVWRIAEVQSVWIT
jgi:hypothetical protein